MGDLPKRESAKALSDLRRQVEELLEREEELKAEAEKLRRAYG